MYGDLITQMEAWKEAQVDQVTADKLVCGKPCFLLSACLVASSVGAATVVLRDGHSTSGDALITLGAPTSGNDHRNFSFPIYFKKGLYADVGSNVTELDLHYIIRQYVKKD